MRTLQRAPNTSNRAKPQTPTDRARTLLTLLLLRLYQLAPDRQHRRQQVGPAVADRVGAVAPRPGQRAGLVRVQRGLDLRFVVVVGGGDGGGGDW